MGWQGLQEREKHVTWGAQLPPSPPTHQCPGAPCCYLSLLSGACHLAGGDGDHVRVDSQAEERGHMYRTQGEEGHSEQSRTSPTAGHGHNAWSFTSWWKELFGQLAFII